MTTADYLPQFRAGWSPEGLTCLLVVDLQYATGSRHHGLGRNLAAEGRDDVVAKRFDRIEQVIVPNTRRLLAGFRERGLPVVYVVNGSHRDDYGDMSPHMRKFAEYVGIHVDRKEYEILDEVAPEGDDLVLTKTTAGAFHSTGIDRILRSMGVTNVVTVGVSTNACVDTTARGACEHGYATMLVEDATGSSHEHLHEAALQSFSRLFGQVASTQDVLDAL